MSDKTETEVVAELIAALEMSTYEFITLKARLSEPYRTNAQACIDRGNAAVKAAQELYDTKPEKNMAG